MNAKKTILSVVKGTLYAVIVTLALVLLFALLLDKTGIPSGAIKPVTQVIKVLSVFIGAIIALRGVDRHGWLFAVIVGVLYTVLSFFIFSILDNNFAITVGLLNDMLFASAAAAISALIVRFAKGPNAE